MQQPLSLVKIARDAIKGDTTTNWAPQCCASGCPFSVTNISQSYVFDKEIFHEKVFLCEECKQTYHINNVFIILVQHISSIKSTCICNNCSMFGSGKLKMDPSLLNIEQNVFNVKYDYNDIDCETYIKGTLVEVNRESDQTNYIFNCKVKNFGKFSLFNHVIFKDFLYIEFKLRISTKIYFTLLDYIYDKPDPKGMEDITDRYIKSIIDYMTKTYVLHIKARYCCYYATNRGKKYTILRNYGYRCICGRINTPLFEVNTIKENFINYMHNVKCHSFQLGPDYIIDLY